ncbi:MAG: hypothetical protein LC798_12710 [Chloroflexi bacterium]|nr:hypothetical protein [Chloroflexota bacterium]
MAHPTRDWKDGDPASALTAEAIEALEERTYTYSDQYVAGKPIPAPGAAQNGKHFVYDNASGAMVWSSESDPVAMAAGGRYFASVAGILPGNADNAALLRSLLATLRTAETPGVVPEIFFDKRGSYLLSTYESSTRFGFRWSIPVATPAVFTGVPGAKLVQNCDASMFFASGAGRNASGMVEWADWSDAQPTDNSYTNITYYALAGTVTRFTNTLTLATPANGGASGMNLQPGDIIKLVTGQLVNLDAPNPPNTEPQGQYNIVKSFDPVTGVITCERPWWQTFAQEYFKGAANGGLDGNRGKTDTTDRGVPANNGAARFGVTKVTDRCVNGFQILAPLEIDATFSTRSAIIVRSCVRNYRYNAKARTKGSLHDTIEFFDFGISDYDVHILGRDKEVWPYVVGTSTSDGTIENVRATSDSQLQAHFHEGAANIVHRDCSLASAPGGSWAVNVLSIRARAALQSHDNITIVNGGTAGGAAVQVSDECPDGGRLGGLTIAGTAFSNAIVVDTLGWKLAEDEWRIFAGDIFLPSLGMTQANPVVARDGWLNTEFPTLNLGSLTTNTEITAISLYVDPAQPFNADVSVSVGHLAVAGGPAEDREAYAATTLIPSGASGHFPMALLPAGGFLPGSRGVNAWLTPGAATTGRARVTIQHRRSARRIGT